MKLAKKAHWSIFMHNFEFHVLCKRVPNWSLNSTKVFQWRNSLVLFSEKVIYIYDHFKWTYFSLDPKITGVSTNSNRNYFTCLHEDHFYTIALSDRIIKKFYMIDLIHQKMDPILAKPRKLALIATTIVDENLVA